MSEELIISYSELDAYRQCPFKHRLAYKQRWAKPPSDNSALGKGTLWHLVLERHYRTIMDYQVTEDGNTVWSVSGSQLLAECVNRVDNLINELMRDKHDPQTLALVRWMYQGYVDVWALDDAYDIVGVETTHVVPLGEYFDAQRAVDVAVKLKIKVDVLMRDSDGSLWVMDHKSCSTMPKSTDFDFLDQFLLYSYGLGKLGHPVIGSIHSAARTQQNKGDIYKPGDPEYKTTMKAQSLTERFARHKISHTRQQLDNVAQDALADAFQMYSPANHERRHTSSDTCRWRCSYTEACLYGRRTGRDSDTIKMLELTGFTQEYERH